MSKDDRVAYQAAVQMANSEVARIWTTFQAMLAANSLLLVIAGAMLKLLPELGLSHRAIGISGLVLCVTWVLVMIRQFDYYKYWSAWARDREESLGPDNAMVKRAKEFGDGNTGQLHRVRWLGRFVRVEWLVYLVIAVFAYFYVVLFIYSPSA